MIKMNLLSLLLQMMKIYKLNKPINNNDEKKDNNANPIKNTNIKIIKFKENNNI